MNIDTIEKYARSTGRIDYASSSLKVSSDSYVKYSEQTDALYEDIKQCRKQIFKKAKDWKYKYSGETLQIHVNYIHLIPLVKSTLDMIDSLVCSLYSLGLPVEELWKERDRSINTSFPIRLDKGVVLKDSHYNEPDYKTILQYNYLKYAFKRNPKYWRENDVEFISGLPVEAIDRAFNEFRPPATEGNPFTFNSIKY